MILTKKEIMKRYKKTHNVFKGQDSIDGTTAVTYRIRGIEEEIDNAAMHTIKPRSVSDDRWEEMKKYIDRDCRQSEQELYERMETKVLTDEECRPPKFLIGEPVKYKDCGYTAYAIVLSIKLEDGKYSYFIRGKYNDHYVDESVLHKVSNQSKFFYSPNHNAN